MQVQSIREEDGIFKKGTISFEVSNISSPYKRVKTTNGGINPSKKLHTGTTISFIPDETIFGDLAKLDVESIKKKCELKTYLNAGLKIVLTVDKEKFTYYHKKGLLDYIQSKMTNPLYNMDTIFIDDKDEDENSYQIAMVFNNDTEEYIDSFVNSLPLSEGGTQETGLKKALTQVFTDYINKNNLLNSKDKGLQIKGEDIRRGLVCVINMKHDNPLYDGQIKDKMTNPDVDPKIRKIVVNHLTEWVEKNPNLVKKLCQRMIAFAKATSSAKERMKKIVTVNQDKAGLEVTSKFLDCESNDPNKVEIFVVEGDSAKSGTEDGRDYRYQAIYPLRGKVLNTNNATDNRIIDNTEYNEFLKIEFGTNDLKAIRQMLKEIKEGNTELLSNIKSTKIIILTDADSDGSHITILLVNFIYEHLSDMIDLGWIYIGHAPLYRVNIKGKWRYFKNDDEYDKFLSSHISENYKLLNKNYSIIKIMRHYDSYREEFERIMKKYSITKEVLSTIIRNKDIKDIKKELKSTYGLKIFKSGTVTGLYNSTWHSFNLSEAIDESESLSELFEDIDYLKIKYIKTNEIKKLDIYDGMNFLRSTFKYTRNRLKGLGEMDGDELYLTSMNPETRVLTRVTKDYTEEESELFKILFGNNADLRKTFISDYL